MLQGFRGFTEDEVTVEDIFPEARNILKEYMKPIMVKHAIEREAGRDFNIEELASEGHMPSIAQVELGRAKSMYHEAQAEGKSASDIEAARALVEEAQQYYDDIVEGLL